MILPSRKGKSYKNVVSEHDSQVALFDWIRINSNLDERLKCYFAVPNQGQRSFGAYKHFEKEGFQAGVADILGLVASGKYHGHVIEMKRRGNKPTEAQIEFLRRCEVQGYKVNICYSADEAMGAIKFYLSGGNK